MPAAWSSLTSILPAGSVRVLARPFHPRIVAFACPLPADAALPIERKRARGCELARLTLRTRSGRARPPQPSGLGRCYTGRPPPLIASVFWRVEEGRATERAMSKRGGG